MGFLTNPCAEPPAVPDTTKVTDTLTAEEESAAFRRDALCLDDKTFGLALVLGGTVSAGAYTAGVLDFLVEALDEWEKAKKDEEKLRENERKVPAHKVHLAVITGSSGGGVCGSILSRSLGLVYPHVYRDPEQADRNIVKLVKSVELGGVTCTEKDNPFWNVWIETLRIKGFLGKENADASLLDATPIENTARWIADFPGRTYLPQANREWIHDDFELILGLTNLRGIPTKISFTAEGKKVAQSFVEHADYARFGIAVTPAQQGLRGVRHCDEMALLGPLSSVEDWADFAEFAKATGAFPLGFPARLLHRCITDYRFRPIIIPTERKSASKGGLSCGEVHQLVIDGAALLDNNISLSGRYDFFAVDAGATDNAPIELARTYLSGLLGRNDRGKDTADRAVVLIDPFAERPQIDPAEKKGLVGLLVQLIFGLIAESRYQTRDLVLAARDDVFSRFMLTASREHPDDPKALLIGGDAICSARLGAFFGFFDREYSIHDYFLGRKNCETFLKEVFVISDENPVLGIPVTEQKGVEKPIIPLCGSAALPQTEPAWPRWSNFNPEDLKADIVSRASNILDGLTKNIGFWKKALFVMLAPLLVLARPLLLRWLSTVVVTKIANAKRGNKTVGAKLPYV